MEKKISIRGFTLIETLVAALLMIGVVYLIATGLGSLQKVGNRNESQGDRVRELNTSVQYIARVGKFSKLCRKKTTAGVDSLECQIDFSRPADGTTEWVRFIVVNNLLEFQVDENNDGNFTQIRTRSRYSGVHRFQLCDDTDMNTGAGGTCSLEPLALSRFHTATLAPDQLGRYFRFSVENGSATYPAGRVAVQGAFYRRNPTPFTNPSVSYQW